jgi:hypothetical protein
MENKGNSQPHHIKINMESLNKKVLTDIDDTVTIPENNNIFDKENLRG